MVVMCTYIHAQEYVIQIIRATPERMAAYTHTHTYAHTQADCERDMAAAEPVIQAAIEALNSLDKKSLTELKALSSPPAGVDDVTAGVMVSVCEYLVCMYVTLHLLASWRGAYGSAVCNTPCI
jgi:hypothetical protein